MTLNGVLVVRDHARARLPFCDNRLVDFSLGLPPGLTYGREIMKEAFVRSFPDLAQIPFSPSGLPLMSCARDVWVRAQKLVGWHLRRRGLGGLVGPASRPYKDYNSWFRGPLREWLTDLLLDGRLFSRGYFVPEHVQSIVDQHMNGANHAVRLGALLSLELWHRKTLDG